MHIRLTHDFGGRVTQERRVAPGVYALDDPRLFGAGQYLLDTEQATALEDAPVTPKPTPPARKPKAVRP